MRKKLKPTQPANSSVRPWKGGVPIYKVQFGGGANHLLATDTRTAPVHADRKATQGLPTMEDGRRLETSVQQPHKLHFDILVGDILWEPLGHSGSVAT